MKLTKAQKRRADWMAAMESALVNLSPAHAGRVNWDAATFHFNAGVSPTVAASRMAESEAPVITQARSAAGWNPVAFNAPFGRD